MDFADGRGLKLRRDQRIQFRNLRQDSMRLLGDRHTGRGAIQRTALGVITTGQRCPSRSRKDATALIGTETPAGFEITWS
jgi:hypothetical protein